VVQGLQHGARLEISVRQLVRRWAAQRQPQMSADAFIVEELQRRSLENAGNEK